VYVESSLHPWDEADLVVVNDHSDAVGFGLPLFY
jgi:hypothetical protein